MMVSFQKILPNFFEVLKLNDQKFEKIIDSWRSPHIWKKNNDKWELRNTVWKDL